MIERNTSVFKSLAYEEGFLYCGISKAEFLEEEATHLESWLKKGYNGQMSYMENHFDLRLDPRKLVPGAKTVISLLYNYFPEEDSLSKGKYRLSKYTYGKDYHKVIKKKLKRLLSKAQEEIGEIKGRAFVDSAPIMEKAWAKKSGSGWIGKNTNLITKSVGSFYFICELVVDLELKEDGEVKDHCGNCNRCIEACPTDAIYEPYKLDASKCISYLTIELKEEIDNVFKGKMENWMFGCDICQDVCPWNRFSKPHNEDKFQPKEQLLKMTSVDWEELTEDVFNVIFEGSAVKRTQFNGLQRNIEFIKKGSE